jgi:hypothetical protein
MNQGKSPLTEAAEQLTEAVVRETRLARQGALGDLTGAVSAKREAFATFKQARDQMPSPGAMTEVDQQAIRNLLTATNENAIVLEAVKTALDNAVSRFQSALSSLTDPGTYGRLGIVQRHLPAATLDAQA